MHALGNFVAYPDMSPGDLQPVVQGKRVTSVSTGAVQRTLPEWVVFSQEQIELLTKGLPGSAPGAAQASGPGEAWVSPWGRQVEDSWCAPCPAEASAVSWAFGSSAHTAVCHPAPELFQPGHVRELAGSAHYIAEAQGRETVCGEDFLEVVSCTLGQLED